MCYDSLFPPLLYIFLSFSVYLPAYVLNACLSMSFLSVPVNCIGDNEEKEKEKEEYARALVYILYVCTRACVFNV